nr:hypothetical protein [Candidatus Njordarchaeota archaeon]
MSRVKTTINIEKELWKQFSIVVIENGGLRKKNEVIEQLIKDYVQRMHDTRKFKGVKA